MAKPTQAQRNRISDSLTAFFTTQSHHVLGRINDDEDDWWSDSYDDDLTNHLHPLAVDIAAESGEKTANHLGGTYSSDQTNAYLEQVAKSKAQTINATTREQIQAQLDSEEPDPQHVFDVATGSRASGIAFGLATFLAGFGTREAAGQHAFATDGQASKTWVTGDNPRPSHADMDGESVGLDDDFSNGMAWPGQGDAEDSGCNCSIDVEVDVPNAQNRARMFFARAAQRTTTSPPKRVQALAPGVVTMRLYDLITDWGWPFGVSAKDFAASLDELPASTTQIQLHINSPGGDSFEAVAIMNQLRSYPAEIVCIVDGLAASAASVIACGAGRLVMLPNTELMIHDAWGVCIGNAADMTKTAQLLDQCSSNLASVYATKANGDPAEWRGVMTAETWMSPQEAVDAGLCDEIGDPAQYPMAGDAPEVPQSQEEFEELAELFDLAGYRFQGRAKAPTPKTPVAQASGQPSKEGDADMAFLDDVRQRLGVTDAEADEAAVLAALEEVLAEQDPAPVAKVPEGMVVLDQAKYDELMAYAGQVQTLVDERAQNRREGIVQAAIREGKIPPARKQHFMDYLAVDEEGGKAQLEALKPGLVPLAAKGYDSGPQAEVGPDKQPGWAHDLLFPEDKKAS